jgi:hypothetical protein
LKVLQATMTDITNSKNLTGLNFSQNITTKSARTGIYEVKGASAKGIAGMNGDLWLVAKFADELFAFVPVEAKAPALILALSDLTELDLKVLNTLSFDFMVGRVAKFELFVENEG